LLERKGFLFDSSLNLDGNILYCINKKEGVVVVMKSSDFRQKEVINIKDGKRLGVIVDMEFDLHAGRVTAIVVPGPSRWMGFVKSDNDLVIPWEDIRKIGDDVILVEVDHSSGRRA